MAAPYASMYVHPWDVVDEGPETVLERISKVGMKAINLATSYHSGRYILQHNPKKKTYVAEEGVVYFKPDPKLYRNTVLRPRRSSEYKNVDVLRLLLEHAPKYGINVNSWTVAFHNSAFVHTNPELAVVDAFDGKNPNYICPNNPNSRNYLRGLVRDLARYDLSAIMLEAACYPPALEHGEHHEMFGTQVEPFPSELMSTCFCHHCAKKAKTFGLDLRRSQKLVRRVVETSFGLPSGVLNATPFAEMIRSSYILSTDLKPINELRSFQREVVNEIFRESKETLKDACSEAKLQVIAFGGFSGEYSFGRGSEGMNLHSLSNIVDGIDLVVYVREPELVHYLVKWVKFEVGDCPVYVALRPSYPTLFTADTVAAEMMYALQAGASGLAFYNYGWTPLSNFEWIRDGLKASERL